MDMAAVDSPKPENPLPLPTLAAIAPVVGPTGGGIVLTLDGQNFVDGATLTIDGVAATQVSVVSSTRMTALLPSRPDALGQVAVTVTNPDGNTASRWDLFSYYAPWFVVGAQPSSVVAGDFNGDGKQDLATANSGSGNVSILLGDGRGYFAPANNLAVDAAPLALAAADFDGDGTDDVAVLANGAPKYPSYMIKVIPGSSASDYAVKTIFAGLPALSIISGDWNRDGHPDLAATAYGGTNIIFLGDGAGGFASPRYCNWANHSNWLASADVDGDGNPDIVVNDYGSMRICFGDGQGNYANGAKSFFAQSASMSTAAVMVDLNGDQNADLAIADGNSRAVSVMLNDGMGGFAPAIDYQLGGRTDIVIAADFNRDAKLDLAAANYDNGTVSVLHGDGMGGFLAPTVVRSLFDVVAMASADFNGDGRPDLAVASQSSNRVAVLLNVP
jgi:hypothetical protein